jgi:hypothetical protein
VERLLPERTLPHKDAILASYVSKRIPEILFYIYKKVFPVFSNKKVFPVLLNNN